MCDCELCGEENVDTTDVIVSSSYGWRGRSNVEKEYCEDCVHYHAFTCNGCEEVFDNSLKETVGNMSLCGECASNYSTCYHCNEVVHYSDQQYDRQGNAVCESCYESKSVIMDYDYSPSLVFHGEGNRFFGVELEINGGGTRDSVAKSILSSITNHYNYRDFLYAKLDGSVQNGFEIISHPATLDSHMSEFNWEDLLQKARSNGYYNEAYECGLHVHISTAAFGKTPFKQRMRINRLVYFFEKFFHEIYNISSRSDMDAVESYACRHWDGVVNLSITGDLFNLAWSNGRYHAVNLTNEHTVEIRIFNSTLNYEKFIGVIQFCNLITDIAINYTLKQIDSMSWHDVMRIASQSGMNNVLALNELAANVA